MPIILMVRGAASTFSLNITYEYKTISRYFNLLDWHDFVSFQAFYQLHLAFLFRLLAGQNVWFLGQFTKAKRYLLGLHVV